MAEAAWTGELTEKVSRWPTQLRAQLKTGAWQLVGGDENVYSEFGWCADHIVLELGISRNSGSVDWLLYRLKENGCCVQAKETLTKKSGTLPRTGLVTTAAISPLRGALLDYLSRLGVSGRDATSGQNAERKSAWHASAARKNIERQTRLRIVEAFERLQIPRDQWPGFVEDLAPEHRQKFRQAPFQPPVFDGLHQSPGDWAKEANAAWALHRDIFVRAAQCSIEKGVDNELPAPEPARGQGKKSRTRMNTPIDRRYEWAALRLCGKSWKEIAGKAYELSTVTKAAQNVLRLAGWHEMAKTAKRRANQPDARHEFPKWMDDGNGCGVIVKNAEQQAALGPGWKEAFVAAGQSNGTPARRVRSSALRPSPRR
jgi:hypothetical protein